MGGGDLKAFVLLLLPLLHPWTVATAPPCLIATRGSDGVGHRLEADVSCIAAAQHLGLQFLVQPLQRLEHVSLSHGMRAFKHYGVFRKVTPNMTIVRPHMVFIWQDLYCPHKNDWLTRVAQRDAACERDGRTVYVVDDCWCQFWCRTLHSPKWYSVQSALQHIFLRNLQPTMWFHPAYINVVIHARQGDAGHRALSLAWYRRVIAALRRRHAAYRAGGGAALGLRFWVHSDNRTFEYLEWEQPAGPDRVRVFFSEDIDLQGAIDQMLLADLLVMSISALSNFAALVGNMTALVPLCTDRPHIDRVPNWYPVDCARPGNLSWLPWPPPSTGQWQRWRRTCYRPLHGWERLLRRRGAPVLC
eukprot:EG_transcript_13076